MVAEIRRFAADPVLVDEVFAEVIAQQSEQGERLESERTRLLRERQHQAQEIKRLVATITAADKPSPSLDERLSQLKESVEVIDRRLGEIECELNAIVQSAIDPEHVAATLAEFGELWDVLYPQEKTRIVHLLVERVVYGGEQGGVQLVFHSDGGGTLATEARSAYLPN